MQLYNTLSKKERAELIKRAGDKRLTLSFYKYHLIKNPEIFRNFLFIELNKIDVLGRIYIANEGINAQLSLPSKFMTEFKKVLDGISFLENVRLNIAIEHDNEAFLKLKIKLRDKIVADGLKDGEYDLNKNGVHVDADNFNKLLEDKNTITIDMRNHYESEIGHFKGAQLPDVDTFRESLPIIEKKYNSSKENKNILMYCTGGIRCEKASSYMKDIGFKNVFQLEGGIINYLNSVEKENGSWDGECFVFDERVSLIYNSEVGNFELCHGCRNPIDNDDKKSIYFEEGVSCPNCINVRSNEQNEKSRQRQAQIIFTRNRKEKL